MNIEKLKKANELNTTSVILGAAVNGPDNPERFCVRLKEAMQESPEFAHALVTFVTDYRNRIVEEFKEL
jgi:hypothetical protein